MYSAVHVTKSEANKILEVLSLTVAIFFLFITYNDFIFDEKCFLYFNCIFFLHGKPSCVRSRGKLKNMSSLSQTYDH